MITTFSFTYIILFHPRPSYHHLESCPSTFPFLSKIAKSVKLKLCNTIILLYIFSLHYHPPGRFALLPLGPCIDFQSEGAKIVLYLVSFVVWFSRTLENAFLDAFSKNIVLCHTCYFIQQKSKMTHLAPRLRGSCSFRPLPAFFKISMFSMRLLLFLLGLVLLLAQHFCEEATLAFLFLYHSSG